MHPSQEHLVGFVRGSLSDESEDSIANHVEQCPECEATVREIEASSDTLIQALRRPAQKDGLAEEAHCKQMVSAIEQMGRELSFASRQADREPSGEPDDLGHLGHYQLLDRIGQGGMGTVYEALHTKLNKVVALKLLPAERLKDSAAVKRFEREMQAVGGLDHPNIVRATDAGEIDGKHYLVMELVDGVDLSTLVRRIGPLGIADACELIRQAASGLEEAHEHGMVHRDIKPSNLMLAKVRRGKRPPVAKILDMGLALLDSSRADGPELTATGQLMGTVDYMAPEQGMDTHRVDIRADIYSLGASLYRVLTGVAPFPSERYETLMKKMLALSTERPRPIGELRPDVPPELVALLDRLLAKQPQQRPATPGELADDMLPFCEGHNLTALLAAYESAVRGQSNDAPLAGETQTRDMLTSGSADTSSAAPSAPRTAVIEPTIDAPWSPLPQGEGQGEEETDPALGADLPTPAESPSEGLQEPASGRPAVEPVARSGDYASTLSGDLAATPSRDLAAASAAGRKGGNKRLRIAITGGIVSVVLLLGLMLTVTFQNGTIVVEGPDGGQLPDDVSVMLQGDGNPVEITSKDNWTVKASPGQYQVELRGGEDRFQFENGTITVSRFGRTLLRITRHDRQTQPVVAKPPNDKQLADREVPEPASAPFDEVQAKQHQRAWAEYLGVPAEMTNSVGMKLVLIPPGEFCMGTTQEEVDRLLSDGRQRNFPEWCLEVLPEEIPRHRVRITRAFYLGMYEVTQTQYERIMGSNPSGFKESGPDAPVERVSWQDAVDFCGRLSALAKDGELDGHYRLPTEAEWEYACRAGTTTAWYFGDDEAKLSDYAWWKDNSAGKTHPAGQKKPNPFGLYDMHGNVWEPCQDTYYDYTASTTTDPLHVTEDLDAGRAMRGGAWDYFAGGCRSAYRNGGPPTEYDHFTGFRVAFSLASKQVPTRARY